jgi:hypothetical protein
MVAIPPSIVLDTSALSTSAAKVEQHLQQVSVVHDAVTIGVGVGVA